ITFDRRQVLVRGHGSCAVAPSGRGGTGCAQLRADPTHIREDHTKTLGCRAIYRQEPSSESGRVCRSPTRKGVHGWKGKTCGCPCLWEEHLCHRSLAKRSGFG